jgi:hypothetical protein
MSYPYHYNTCQALLQRVAVWSKLDDYLNLPLERVQDPLKWWYNQRRVYPTLHRMALDYLSIPGAIPLVLID